MQRTKPPVLRRFCFVAIASIIVIDVPKQRESSEKLFRSFKQKNTASRPIQTSAKLHFLICELNQLLMEWHAGFRGNEFLRRLGSRVWMEIGEKQRPPYLMEIETILRKQIADFGVIVPRPLLTQERLHFLRG